MTDYYYAPENMKLMKELKALAPVEFDAWIALDRVTGRQDGAIPQKYRELIALAVAHSTQCVHCIEAHAKKAYKAGATREELAEAVFIAAAIRAGGAATHGTQALKFYDQAAEKEKGDQS